jgi:two-component system sensor histidine kinase/response regulator
MIWQLLAPTNIVIAIAYSLISATILRGLLRTGQLMSNRLGAITAAIFVTNAVQHGAHGIHLLMLSFSTDAAQASAFSHAHSWQGATWDLVSALVAVYYVSHRRTYGALQQTPLMFVDQVRAEAAAIVARERELLSDAEELAGAGSFDWDIPGARITWSTGMHRLRGLEPRAAIPISEAVGDLHPDDDGRVQEVMRAALAGDDSRVDQRYRIVRPDGVIRHVETRARIERDSSGTAVRVVGVTVDVTERYEALVAQVGVERQLREATEAVIEASSEAFIASDQYGLITGWNYQAERLLGYSRDEIMGQSIIDTITPPALRASRQADLATFRASGATRLMSSRTEVSLLHKSGHEIPAELAVWGVSVGGDTTFNLFAHDITARKRGHQELASARDEAVEASRLKSTFLANMSHEIRTPMNGVIGMTELLLDTDLSYRQLGIVEVINSSGEALLAIIDQILDFSKIEAGKLELEDRAFDLHEMVTSVCEMLTPLAYQKGLELPLLIGSDVPARVIGDVSRLRQILTNLVGNAVKFTDEGEVSVAVHGVDTGRIEFTVTDTGLGIDQTEKDALFQPFSQADVSTTRRFGGTGLGLSISRQLVRLMGGDITISSELGQGSTFGFTVDLRAAQADVADLRLPSPHNLTRRRVLVVDDNATNRHILSSYLEADAAEVTTATTGTQALRLLTIAAAKNAPFDLVILDERMPGTSGTEVATAMRADPLFDAVALLICSSTGSPEDAVVALKDCLHINKPIRRARLQEAITRLMGSLPEAASLTPSAPDVSSAPATARILLAEDNPVNQQVTKQMLTLRGHQVDVAGNGRQALDKLAEDHYDLVLMDCQMPEMDGYLATAELRRRESDQPGAHIPVIAMTANAMRGERENCLTAGMDDYLSKPFRRHQLNEMLDRWLSTDPTTASAAP